jgi:hypothetical protein
MVARPSHHHVYVVLLNSAVLTKERNFQEVNPGCVPGWPCLYVGMTGLTPEKRFENHKRGYKGNKYVERYGERLAMEFLERGNPMTYSDAAEEEKRLALSLRELGYAVWQN